MLLKIKMLIKLNNSWINKDARVVVAVAVAQILVATHMIRKMSSMKLV